MTSLLLPATAALSGWAVYLSAIAIQDVRQYEEQTKKAAKISQTADNQLQNTRTTQGAGAVASLLSLVSAVGFTVYPSQNPKFHAGFAVVNAAAAFFASHHIMRFWHGKTKVPLVDQYNDAIDKSNMLRRILGGLGIVWCVDALLQTWKLIGG